MQTRMKIPAILALALALPSTATTAMQADVYTVSARLTHAGQSFAEPSIVVFADKPASVESTGPDAYRITLTVSGSSADQIQVAADIDSTHGSMAPTIILRHGEPSSVSVGDLGLELTVTRDDR